MLKFLHSIQWRIFAYYTALICLAIAVLITGFFFFQKKELRRTAELELQTRLVGLIPYYLRPGGPNSKTRPGGPGGRRTPRGPGGARGLGETGGPPIWFGDGGESRRELGDRPNGMKSGGRPPLSADQRFAQGAKLLESVLEDLKSEQIYFYAQDSSGEILEMTDNFPEGLLPVSDLLIERKNWEFVETGSQIFTIQMIPGRGTLVIGKPREVLVADLNALMVKVTLMSLLIIAVISSFGYWMLRSSLRPIKEIGETAERIATGDISERIDVSGVRSELGTLANVLNTTFGRLGEALTRQIQFTSDASHELRTPVAAILADCQFSLKRQRSPERYRETIEVCHESAQHMRSLIEDLRDLAHFDEKDTGDVSELVDMKEFLSNVISVMNPLAAEKGVELDSELDSAMVQIDPMRMRQAILNLLGNALRYTESGGQIVVRCGAKLNQVVIEVCDTGIGISAEKLEHIFDRFYRADEARATHTGGVGLGLSISKAIVEANGGEIKVESEEGTGTCFRIHLAVTQVG